MIDTKWYLNFAQSYKLDWVWEPDILELRFTCLDLFYDKTLVFFFFFQNSLLCFNFAVCAYLFVLHLRLRLCLCLCLRVRVRARLPVRVSVHVRGNMVSTSCYSIMVCPLDSVPNPNPKTNPSIHNTRWGNMKYLLVRWGSLYNCFSI